jgi:hypothetical protein
VNHFINTAATDLSRARTVGLNQLTPEPFPVLVVGTRSNHQFFFASRGTLETWSGDPTYRLRVTIGDAYAAPIASTFKLTAGNATPIAVPFDVDQAGLQNTLNGITAVGTTDGGVDVISQGLGRFLIAYRVLGAPATTIATDGALLTPDCVATLVTLTAGSSTTRALLMLTLQRTVPARVVTWSTITTPYAGWSGVIPLDSSAAIELLRINGVQRGEMIECATLITVEVIDPDANPFAYFQAPIILRANNSIMPASTDLTVGPSSSTQTAAAPGTTNVAPTSQIHTATITFSGIAGTYNVLVNSDNLVAGARIDIVALFTGANSTRVKIYANTTGGTLLFDFTRAGDEANALFVIYANGLGSFKDKQQVIPAF